MENSFFSRRWTNQTSWRRSGTENIHLDTGAPNSRRTPKGFSWRIRRVSTSTTSRLTSGCRRSDQWFLVYVRKLHIPPSRWTQSQTLLAERRIFPYSTEMHWRYQNYKDEFGCCARTPRRWLLEYRWFKRFVWFLDRFHSIYCIGRKTSRRIYVVQGETDKTAGNIQARSFMARTLDEIGKKCFAEEKQKWAIEKPNSKMPEDYEEFIWLTLRTRSSKKPLRKLKRNWKHQWLPPCLARRARKARIGRPAARHVISRQNLCVSWKPVYPQDCVWKNLYRMIMKTIQFGTQIYFYASSNEDTRSKSSSG